MLHCGVPVTCLGAPPLNVVLLLLDDMRYDQVAAMPEVTDRLVGGGLSFTRAYAATPLCAPARASLLSGGYPTHEVGVLTNEIPNGGIQRFVDVDTLATRLQEQGYTTALIGKYLNGYDEWFPYIAPGWTEWIAWIEQEDWSSYALVEGGSTPAGPESGAVVHHDDYIADHQADAAIDFITRHAEDPFFLYVPFLAPHTPHTPASEDESAFADYRYRGGAYQEADLSDKPEWMRRRVLLSPAQEADADAVNRQQLQSLLPVDRAIGAILDTLDAAQLSDHTLVIFTSDNGQLWGEHRLFDKGLAYEESIHVPLVIWAPGGVQGEDDSLVSMTQDVAATMTSATGLTRRSDGLDLLPRLCGVTTRERDHLLLQGWATANPDWAAVLTPRYKYVEWTSGDTELYDRETDPTESTSLHAAPDQAANAAALAAILAAERALDVATINLPVAATGIPYETTLATWGGVPPYTWSLHSEALPPGLLLHTDGSITGTARQPGDYVFTVTVSDGGRSPYHGGPQRVVATVRLTVTGEPMCGCLASGPVSGSALWLACGVAWLRRRRGAGA